MTNTAGDILRGSAYDGPELDVDGWTVKFNPHAGTVSVNRGPRYFNTDTDEDTEPVTIYGVDYAVRALFVLDGSGKPTLDRVSGFRVDGSSLDMTPAARSKAGDLTFDIISRVPDLAKIGAAMDWHQAVAKVRDIEGKRDELAKQLADAERELAEAKAVIE